MTTEENKAIVRNYVEECWNKKNLSAIPQFIAPECPHHMNGPVNFAGPEGFKRSIESWSRAFPDLKIIIEDEMAEGNKVVTRGRLTGTHNGDMKFGDAMPKAIPATGTRLDEGFVSIAYMADGKIVENWNTMNFGWIWGLRQG